MMMAAEVPAPIPLSKFSELRGREQEAAKAAADHSAPVPLTKWNHKRQQEEGKVASLMELGFGRADACGALESAKGDVDVAAAMLFSNMQ